jgi:hypothetical protein
MANTIENSFRLNAAAKVEVLFSAATDDDTNYDNDTDDQPIPVEPDGGIGDGAGPIPTGEGPFPVEPDGGIGDGVDPILLGDGPFPVEPDGGIGDGVDPILLGDGPFPVEPDGGIGDGVDPILLGDGPFPVEPDGGIGDGADPILLGDGPFPVEPNGGIGDGALPIGVLVTEINTGTPSQGIVFAGDVAETFYFTEGDSNGAVFGFDPDSDSLNFAMTATDFGGLDDLQAASSDFINPVTGNILGISIDLGNGQYGFINGISVADLGDLSIDF